MPALQIQGLHAAQPFKDRPADLPKGYGAYGKARRLGAALKTTAELFQGNIAFTYDATK